MGTSSQRVLLPRDSSSGAHPATASLLVAALPADSGSGRLDGLDALGSPLPALTAVRPARIHPATDAKKTAVSGLAYSNNITSVLTEICY
jgi:hypothetical protein